MPFELVSEMPDGTAYRPCRGITQRANRVSFDLSSNIYQQIDVAYFSVSVFQTVQYFFHPAGPFTARAALSAGFVVIKAGKIPGVTNDTCVFIHHNKTNRTQIGRAGKATIGK